jgi:hypothetical protein
MSKSKQVGRLAFRVEVDWWVAYYAHPDTMADALELGRVRLLIVEDCRAKELFMALMRDAVSAIIKDATGADPIWPDPPRPAPENERAGKA